MRKRGQDGKPFTATETHLKNRLMRQFVLDGPKGASVEYRNNYDNIRWSDEDTNLTKPPEAGEWTKT